MEAQPGLKQQDSGSHSNSDDSFYGNFEVEKGCLEKLFLEFRGKSVYTVQLMAQ